MSGAILQTADVHGRGEVRDEADVVIVGSGAAGATAARVLTEAGIDVIVIEEGPHVPLGAHRTDMYTTFHRQWRDMGFQVARGRAITPILQGSCVGGTTAINGAIIHRVPEKVFDTWVAEHGAGDFLKLEELHRVYDVLDAELAVGPAPDAVFGKQNALMERAVAALGWTGNRIRRNVKGCEGSAHCNQGCPNGRRQSMDNSYVPRAVAAGARVYATCAAQQIVVESGRAVGVRGTFRDRVNDLRGPTLSVRARRAVLLAASAIQTPLLLQQNRLGHRKLVGARLQTHPGTAVAGVFDDPIEQWFGATQGYETTHFWNERMKFETVGMPLEFASVRLPGFGPRLSKALAGYGHVAFFGVQVRARAHGRVGRNAFGQKSISFDLGPEDLRSLKLGVKRLVAMMFAAGAREVYPGVHGLPERIDSPDAAAAVDDLPDDPRLFHCIAAHLFGTAVMGRDPATSVVRPDGRLHDVDGLYVTDSSIFPTNLGVNPQHTICAVSWLVAERIADSAKHRTT